MNRNRIIGVVSDDPGFAKATLETARHEGQSGSPGDCAVHSRETAWFLCTRPDRFERIDDDRGFCIVLGHPRVRGSRELNPMRPEQVLDAYRRHGPGFLDGLAGGFALIVHDASRRSTLAGVDRFGIHSLAYRALDGGVIVGRFADEVANFLPGGSDLSVQSLFDYLYFHVIPAPGTVYSSVKRLEAAHFVEFAEGRLTVRRYWQPSYAARERSMDDMREEFMQLMRDAVAREILPDATASYLSGGTDSSSVTGWLSRVADSRAKCFSIGFDAAGYDEMEYARIAARHFGAEHHEYYVTPEDIVAGVPVIAAHYDQPFGNSSALPAYFCASKARDNGVSVMLAGDGGDEIFGGNTRYAKQKVFEFYGDLPDALRKGVLEPVFLGTGIGNLPLARKVGSYIRQAKLGLPARLETYNLLTRLGAANVLTSPVLEGVDQDAPARHQAEVFATCTDPSVVNRMLAYDLKFTLADTDLPKVVHTAELAGCEARFPMLADELVDFANGLPELQKVNGVKLRYFFKEASRGFLPDEILKKSKHGFGLPFGAWVASNDALREFAADSLAGLCRRRLVHASFVDEVMGARLAEHSGYYGEAIWILMMLEQWLRARSPGFSL
ncbi:MAG: asparagine synthase [Betaproteobacteria bacterium]|nr:asparagine synthase [Betaproteobacteria bacterium]